MNHEKKLHITLLDFTQVQLETWFNLQTQNPQNVAIKGKQKYLIYGICVWDNVSRLHLNTFEFIYHIYFMARKHNTIKNKTIFICLTLIKKMPKVIKGEVKALYRCHKSNVLNYCS